jgi:hypothetical protein
MDATADDAEYRPRIGAFLQELAQLGWSIGRNVRIELRRASAKAANIRNGDAWQSANCRTSSSLILTNAVHLDPYQPIRAGCLVAIPCSFARKRHTPPHRLAPDRNSPGP